MRSRIKKAPSIEARIETLAAATFAFANVPGGWRVASAFEHMKIAEDEIAERWPRSSEPRGIFLLMCPTTPLQGCTATFYRAHVRELLDRVKEGRRKEVALLTRAEIVCLMSAASLRHPLKYHDACVMERLFASVAPEAFEVVLGARTHLEDESAEIDATIAEWLRTPSPERSTWKI